MKAALHRAVQLVYFAEQASVCVAVLTELEPNYVEKAQIDSEVTDWNLLLLLSSIVMQCLVL